LETARQEKGRNSATMGFKPCCKCRELRKFIEKIDSEKKQLETDLREQMEYYEKRLQYNAEPEAALYTRNGLQNELKEQNRAIRELQATLLRQCEELCVVRVERDSANQRIQELENKKQMKELNNKELESSVCSKMKNLAAVSVVVGVVAAAAGWWLLS
jgi:chromosome segregation ATPase